MKQIIEAANISEEDREFVRSRLIEAAERLRKKYGLKIPVIRDYVCQMVDVSI